MTDSLRARLRSDPVTWLVASGTAVALVALSQVALLPAVALALSGGAVMVWMVGPDEGQKRRRPGPLAILFILVVSIVAAGFAFFVTCIGAINANAAEWALMVCIIAAVGAFFVTAKMLWEALRPRSPR